MSEHFTLQLVDVQTSRLNVTCAYLVIYSIGTTKEMNMLLLTKRIFAAGKAFR